MKKLLLLIVILISNISIAQWKYEIVNRPFSTPYPIAYNQNEANALLKLENSDGTMVFYLTDDYFCTEYPEVDISFLINGKRVEYTKSCFRSEDGETIFISLDAESLTNFVPDFKSATSISIRVNETENCVTYIYTFSMKGSAAAYNFMKTN
jgi:hypothetical protein